MRAVFFCLDCRRVPMPFHKLVWARVVRRAVSRELVSGDFPVKQGKYREYSQNWPMMGRIWRSNRLISLGYLAKFPSQRNREFFRPNRERIGWNRDLPHAPQPLPPRSRPSVTHMVASAVASSSLALARVSLCVTAKRCLLPAGPADRRRDGSRRWCGRTV